MDSPQVEFARAIWVVFGAAGILALTAFVAVFFSFRFLSTKWLDGKFAERLESFKHAQQIEIENTKYRINSLFDRSTRAHIKEYEYLPNIWASLNEAYRSGLQIAVGFRQHPNFYAMTSDDLERVLSVSDLDEFDREKMRKAYDKNRTWSDIQNRKELYRAYRDHAELRSSLGKYSIFFSEDLQVELEIFADVIWDALIEFEIYRLDALDGQKPERKAREELRLNGGTRLKALERKVRDRLWSADSSAL